MELSKRLGTVAEAVTAGCRVADVGTDHGYVPIYLVREKGCKKAYAMDVNKGPLERAEAHIRMEGMEDVIEVRRGDGLSALEPEEADSVVIAGMGGELICRILREASRFLEAGTEFVLQPQSEWFKVRHLLHEAGYRIAKEWFLKEEGKYYVVLKALPAGEEKEQYEEEFCYEYGASLLRERHPVLLEYLQKEVEKREHILEKMRRAASGEKKAKKTEERNVETRERRCRELEKEIKKIKEYLDENPGGA
ncbi:MAG: class I SAM-dependent methyltransferase [Eubacteriales bacterium]|nr:class I SAM-dependent methyltransferase [Eubacteriales bacterium]